MAEIKIAAEARTEFGKGAARRIRRADKVPAVLYGSGIDPVHITLPGHDTMMALKHGGSNALLTLDIEGKTVLALTKQVQADPIKGFLEHVDFVEVKKGEKVTVDIPIHVLGESKSDAMTVTELNNVSVEAEATNIPEYLEISVEDADAGDAEVERRAGRPQHGERLLGELNPLGIGLALEPHVGAHRALGADGLAAFDAGEARGLAVPLALECLGSHGSAPSPFAHAATLVPAPTPGRRGKPRDQP